MPARLRFAFLLLAVSIGCLGRADSARAQTDVQGQRVFFSGHSFHVFMPPILADIAKKADVKGHTQVGLSSIGGSRVLQHWDVVEEKNQAKKALGTQHRFLLIAGLGLDSSLIAHVSKSLKYRIGRLAYGVSAVKDLPEQRPFPLELRAIADDGSETLLWQGEAWQVIFGNTRLYAGFAEVTPQAYVDDGNLDVAVIPAGDVFQTVEEVVSLLVKHRSASAATEYFHGAHFSVRVPASIGLHLDGYVVELDDYLSTSEKDALAQAISAEQPLVEYRFDAEPAALHMAIPPTYHGTLFEHWTAQAHPPSGVQQQNEPVAQAQPAPPERVHMLLQQGTKVTVTGVGPQADKPNTFIIAGTRHHPTTEDTSPIAVRVTDKSMVLQRTGQHVPPPAVQHLPEGAEIVVEGKKGKSGSLRATQVAMERIESRE